MKVAVEGDFTGSFVTLPTYDSTKVCLGEVFRQNTGALLSDKWVGPYPVAVARPQEQSVATVGGIVHALRWSNTIDWVFLADNSTAALTRSFCMYEYNRSLNTFNWRGRITANFVTNTGNKTIRGLRAVRTTHSSGTVAVSGTAVTGTSTAFTTDRIAAGARIGFGSTDPTQITTWFNIASIASDTALTLASTAGTIAAGTSYVIEELRIVFCATNATATNGGLFVMKGLNPSTFTSTGTNIAEAGTADNVQGIYWLADAATVTNTVATGMGIDDTSSTSQHFVWVFNGTTTMQVFKYNIRASLASLTAGRSTSAFVFATGVSPALTGTAGATNNGRVFTVAHGPASGVKSLWFVTTTRIYRVPETAITSGSTTFLSLGDTMAEVPPGGSNTITAVSNMATVDYTEAADRLVLMMAAGSNRSYMTQYLTSGSQFETLFLGTTQQLDQAAIDSNAVSHPTLTGTNMQVWTEGGLAYLVRQSTASSLNQLYAVPLAPHWTYAQSAAERVITPIIATPNATKLYRAYVNNTEWYGGTNFGQNAEPIRMYARTSGMSDNTGSWTMLDDTGDLSGFGVTSGVQLMFEFRTLGLTCLPSKIFNYCVTYENETADSHYTPSVGKSSVTGRTFAWRQQTTWGGTIPTLRLRLYNVANGTLVLDDTTASSASGTWQYSTNGTSWSAWSSSADVIGYYIRYVATSLPNGVTLRALLTQN